MENISKMRTCTKCNKEKSLDKFHKQAKRCTSCQGVYMARSDKIPDYKHRSCLKCDKVKYIEVPKRICETCTQDNAYLDAHDYAVFI